MNKQTFKEVELEKIVRAKMEIVKLKLELFELGVELPLEEDNG